MQKRGQINRLNFPSDPASGLAAQVGLRKANMGGYRGALYPESIAGDFNRFGAYRCSVSQCGQQYALFCPLSTYYWCFYYNKLYVSYKKNSDPSNVASYTRY